MCDAASVEQEDVGRQPVLFAKHGMGQSSLTVVGGQPMRPLGPSLNRCQGCSSGGCVA
jgi:hypothetical protein